MATRITTVQMSGSMRTTASFFPSTINVEDRTVEVVFASDREVLMYDWNIGRFNEILVCEPGAGDLTRLNNGAPLLNTHRQGSTSDVFGVVVAGTARFEGGKAIAKVRFSKRADVEPTFQDVKDGILTGISVGYMPHEYEEVKNVQDTIPTMRCTRWEATEISLAPVQADPDSRIRSAGDDTQPHTVHIIRTHSNSDTMENQQNGATSRYRTTHGDHSCCWRRYRSDRSSNQRNRSAHPRL